MTQLLRIRIRLRLWLIAGSLALARSVGGHR